VAINDALPLEAVRRDAIALLKIFVWPQNANNGTARFPYYHQTELSSQKFRCLALFWGIDRTMYFAAFSKPS